MKIKKFNENLNPIKFSIEDIKKVDKLQKEIVNMQTEVNKINKEIEPYFIEFLKIHRNLLYYDNINFYDDSDFENFKIDSFSVYFSSLDPETFLELYYWDQSPFIENTLMTALFTKEDINNFLNFTKNCDIYKDTKKYNL